MKIDVYLVKKVSQKAGKEPFTYVYLYADLGYDKLVVTMDKDVIAKILDVTVRSVFDMVEPEKPKKVLTFVNSTIEGK